MRENILWLRRIAPQPKTELPAKTDCRLAAVFCPKTTAKPRPNTKPKSDEARHITPLSTRGCGMEAKPQCSRRRRDWLGYIRYTSRHPDETLTTHARHRFFDKMGICKAAWGR